MISQLDRTILLALNGAGDTPFSHAVLILTNGLIWLPLYAALLYLVVRNNPDRRRLLTIILAIALCMAISNGIVNGLVKPLVGRLRPSVEPSLSGIVSLAFGYTGGGYSFFSAHACNTFTVAVFFSLLVRNKILTLSIISWALLNCWTRLFLAVHYPSDILVGILTGCMIPLFVHRLFLSPRLRSASASTTSATTSSSPALTESPFASYRPADAYIVAAIVPLTILAVFLYVLA